MRLKHIKLAGFKSFVDSTTIKFPDPMTAIVGPNGCGKSNVIDAVRWVLGESSAKNLRGDAMSDVIFNGASQRKPVSQASVELLFSDTQGRLSGSLADRNEVAIKRVVNRDGQNQYYLNGSKCRRRDVVDIFLGTGLGPRSYAIIEQGMISRLIESKPKDLRVFIDEAAGISKYKERRRETEIRLRHTEENLERLQDIQQTLQEQVEKLAQQAEQAREYKTLRQEERSLQQQVWVAKWQNYQKKLDDLAAQLKVLAAQDVQIETELNELNARWEIENEQLRDNETQQHDTQQQLLGLTQQCAKLEQQLQHQQQLQKSAEQQLHSLAAERKSLHAQHSEQQTALAQCINQEADIQPQLELLQASCEELQLHQQQHQEQTELAQHRCEKAKEQKHQLSLQQQRVQAELNSLQSQQQQLSEQLAKQRQVTFETVTLQTSLVQVQSEHEQITLQLEAHQTVVNDAELAVTEATVQHQQLKVLLQQHDEQLQQRNLEIVSLQSQQALVDDAQSSSLIERLDALGVTHQSVWGQLNVHSQWQAALETVMSAFSSGAVVTAFPDAIESAHIALITCDVAVEANAGALSAQVTKGIAPAFLNTIGTAETLAEARQQLSSGKWQSLVTKQGDWIGQNWWLRGNGQSSVTEEQSPNATSGFFARQEQLDELLNQQTEQQQLREAVATQSATSAERLTQCEQHERDVLQEQQSFAARQQQKTQHIELAQQRLQHEQQREAEQQEMLERWELQRQDIEEQLAVQTAQLDELLESIALKDDELLDAQQVLTVSKQTGQATQQQLQRVQQQINDTKLQVQDIQWQKKHCQQSVEQLQTQLASIEQREQQLHASQISADEAELLDARLQEELEQKLVVEQQLHNMHSDAQQLDANRQKTHQAVQRVEANMKQNAEKQQKLRVDHERQRVLQETIHAQLQQLDNAQTDLTKPLVLNIAQAEKQIQRLQQKVREMGPVNLAAIAEYEAQSEKLNFMQQQHSDLSLAVETLQKAIQKIDRETRQRFKETFDKINAGLQELFPKVFAGGSAWLALTEEEDVLDAGVHIMARPPGKKNATIHLLSGGEKALTALSLVFAIFRLNPAPFCLLDEVDAPLDDANVGRFCNLVQEMSGNVQFIYISHNKVAMEMAAQLIGVTMYEPGVSRVVAVDVAEALQFADA